MKKLVLVLLVGLSIQLTANAQKTEYKIITSVESIVPSGLGRSRIIEANDSRDHKTYTTTQTEEDKSRNKSKRKEMRVKGYDETKLLNFYNLGGIRFQNIATNDAIITSKINALVAEGWELVFINTGVESFGGKGDGNGIYITRYTLKRTK
ncbi:MAG TPA: hypothetical protein EYG80_00980 [Flavobacteriaceae bacterium]|nr:hypothetical protein [Flavobacteriaceae bacterium]HIP26214.1 hypothetical protein [Flavobacteriaceae bacterium]